MTAFDLQHYQPGEQLYLWWLANPAAPRLIGELRMARSLKGGIQRAVMGAQIKTIEMAMGVNQHTKITCSSNQSNQRWPGRLAHCTSKASSNNTRLRLALLKTFWRWARIQS